MTWYASLDEFKIARFVDIDKRTGEVLARGFVYNSVTISLSAASLLKYQTLSTVGLLSAPVTVEAADPLQDPLTLASLLNPAAFLASVNAYLRSVYEAETLLKSAIRASTTAAQIEAVVDSR
jgi:hypothetical protein